VPAPAEVGSTANNYQILARLAVGGMAEIFLARGLSAAGVERYCVLKRILRERAADLHFVRMFLDEARLAAQLNHPNVAQVYDIGKLADSYFFTMEYVHGETVRAVIQRARSARREVPIGSILTMMAGAAAGLHHAHDRNGLDGRPLGIVHRDVSPSNLMVSFEGGVKVVDFGVAKAADRMSETRAGTVKGKISYLSPEQCRGTPVDRRTDLFALGIVMWEMLTLERLYRRASDFENMNAIVNETPPLPSSRRRSVPPELDAIVMRLLAKDPQERFQTADDLIGALEQVSAATGAMISSSTLGRLMREMFGQRPEPWLEMEPQEAPEGVTVTSEPIPSELGLQLADSMDLQLAGVPDLSSHRVMTQDDGVPLPMGASASGRHGLTAPLRVTGRLQGLQGPQGADASSASELAPRLPPPPGETRDLALEQTQPGELPLPAPPATVPEVPPEVAGRRSGPGLQPMTMTGSGRHSMSGAGGHGVPVPPSGGHAVTGSGRHSMPGAGGHTAPGSGGYAAPGSGGYAAPGSGGYAAPGSGGFTASGVDVHAAPPAGAHSLPPAAALVALEEPAEKPARGWPMLAVILAAMVIGSLTVLLVMKTGGRGASSSDTAVARGRAQEPTGGAAGPIVTPIDADAGAPTVGAPGAPAGADTGPVAAAAPTAETAAGPPEPPKPPLEAAMDNQRYDEVVALCTKRFPSERAAICTLAACHARNEAKARGWFQRVTAGERPRLIGLCRSLGIDPVLTRRAAPLKPPPAGDADDKCERNPMACQH
jgi:serine/threonine protein kinase